MAPGRARLCDVRLLGRHQIAAFLATATDFSVMIALVELGHLEPPLATIVGAASGGVTNFTVGRAWAFQGLHTGSLAGQAARYAMASLGGALINGALLALVLDVIDVPYVLARAIISFGVSILYTYPVHTRFVFGAIRALRTRGTLDE